MAYLAESSTWESGIYQLETADPVQGGAAGVSNTQPGQLANRTKKIHDVLEENGIFITGSLEYKGQNIIPSATFEGTVSDGDLVYYHSTNTRFEKALADETDKEKVVGIANVTDSQVFTGGLVGLTVGGASVGDILYLSDTVAGEITTTVTTKAVGQYLYSSIIFLSASSVSGISGLSEADILTIIDTNKIGSSRLSRSTFVYNGGSAAYTIKIGGGIYRVKDKTAKWDAELTTAAIGTPAADTWYYLYLDYPAITSLTDITANELIWSTTAPSTFDHEHKGRYNGDDLCIFAVYTNDTPNNIEIFYHDGGDLVKYDTGWNVLADVDIDTTWTDVTLAIPAFSTKGTLHIQGNYVDAETEIRLRTNGSSSGVFGTGFVNSSTEIAGGTPIMMTDADQKIEVSMSADSGNTIGVSSTGFYFPIGM